MDAAPGPCADRASGGGEAPLSYRIPPDYVDHHRMGVILWLMISASVQAVLGAKPRRAVRQVSPSPGGSDSNQGNGSFALQHLIDLPSKCDQMTMTMRHDTAGRELLFVASKEGGLKIYHESLAPGASSPTLLQTIPITAFGGRHAMSLAQQDNTVYVALGNFFGNAQQGAGFAAVDVTQAGVDGMRVEASVSALWLDSGASKSDVSGAGAVEVVGGYIYLAAMKRGLMIFDLSVDGKPTLLSRHMPSIHFPGDRKPDPAKFNFRALSVVDNLLYGCIDAGGLHIFDVTNRSAPLALGRYANPALLNKPRAYNGVAVAAGDGLAYVAVDYCGMEVINVSDPSSPTLLSWYHAPRLRA